MKLKLHEWQIINAEGACLGVVLTGTKDRGQASKKLRHRFNRASTFLQLKYKGVKKL